MGELLNKAGYATAHYGKWHIAGGGPGAHGYDEHDSDTGNENAFKFLDPNPVDIFGMAERAAKFISERNDLTNQMPRESKMLKERLDKVLIDVHAQLPTKNTEFDPSQPIAPLQGGRGGDKAGGKGGNKGKNQK